MRYLQQKSSDKLKGRCTRDKKLDQEVKDYLDKQNVSNSTIASSS